MGTLKPQGQFSFFWHIGRDLWHFNSFQDSIKAVALGRAKMTYSLWQIQLSLVCYMHTTSSSTVRPVKIGGNLMTHFNFTLKTNANSAKMFLIFSPPSMHSDGNVLFRKQSNPCSFINGCQDLNHFTHMQCGLCGHTEGREKHTSCSIILNTLALSEL